MSLHEAVPTLAPLMAKADLAIGAGGATTWERCCLGLPAVVITIAENQKAVARELAQRGLIRWFGDANEVRAPQLLEALERILGSGLDPAWSHNCQQLVDGRGTQRVLESILGCTDR